MSSADETASGGVKDTHDRWLGLHRVVMVTGGTAGSGYAIGPNTILTADHLVAGRNTANVYLPHMGRSVRAQVQVRFGDIAILIIIRTSGQAIWPDIAARETRFARLDGDRSIRCIAFGFPLFQQSSRGRSVETLRGTIMATTLPGQPYSLDLDVAAPRPRDEGNPWQGYSGAVVMTEDLRLVVGVIHAAAGSHPDSRLLVSPIHEALVDIGFQKALTVTESDVEVWRADEPMTLLDQKLSQAFEPQPTTWSDSLLLLPEFRAVTFLDRGNQLDSLSEWCDHGDLLRVAAITGDGGSGKSRLAAELCWLKRDDWTVGLWEPSDVGRIDLSRKTLAVVDYVEESAKAKSIVDILNKFARRRRGPRLRLILLARKPVTEWWQAIDGGLKHSIGADQIRAVHLSGSLLTVAMRRDHASRAVTEFAQQLGVSAPDLPDIDYQTVDNPLLIHFAALLAVRGDPVDPAGAGMGDVLRQWFNHNLRYWRRVLANVDLHLTDEELLETLALVTLVAPVEDDVDRLLDDCSPTFTAMESFARNRAGRWLREVLGGHGRLTVVPDLLAEYLLKQVPTAEALRRAARDFEATPTVIDATPPLDVIPSDAPAIWGGRSERLLLARSNPFESYTSEYFDPELRAAVTQIAQVPQLLVACDYDGTLAPIVEDPTQAVPLPEAVAAVRTLASLPQTTVAIISGRALRDLTALSRLPSEVHLVGSHGAEFDVGFAQRLSPQLINRQVKLQGEMAAIARTYRGVRLESKPASVAMHTRGVDPDIAAAAVDAVRGGPALWPDVHTTQGKEVIELSVIFTHKGNAVDALRMQLSASAVLFIGDDVTDENAFAHLHGPDVGIKVGTGETAAEFRVADPTEASRVLALLLETRRHWLFGERAVPIERHSMLADGNTVALVTPDARISWLCHPRPDSAAVFADLVGGSPAGYFTVRPERAGTPLGQRYRPGTMTIETRWSGLTVTDWLDKDSLTRRITGSVPVVIEFAPRPGFGHIPISLQPLDGGLLVLGSNEPMALHSDGVEWEIGNYSGSARAYMDLRSLGGEVVLELRFGSEDTTPHPLRSAERLETIEKPWRDWAASLKLPGKHRDLVLRSALTLRGLCYAPTGGILAAATTSLPEELGGVRNWDYRHCRIADAAMAAYALVDLGSMSEAEALLRWVDGCVERTGGHPERLQSLYGIDGLPLGPEAVIDTLPGYAGSRPVRVGNTSGLQTFLGTFGAIADLLAAVVHKRGMVHDDEWRVLKAMVQAVERRWHEPDQGLWPARIAPRHTVYSKVMCWTAVDRALSVAQHHSDQNMDDWVALRDHIAENVLEHGWNEEAQAYSVAYGHPEMDASSLWIGLSGLLPDDDPRFLATVLAVEADLRSGPVVYRYRWDDGLPGREGGFHICTAWLIEAYLRTGRWADAEELFEQMLAAAGPTGLLPEQYDPDAERGLGNHPHAMSHAGLIRVAQLLS